MVKWYLCCKEDVTGPFTTDEVKSRANSGQIQSDSRVWGNPVDEWLNIRQWTTEIDQILEKYESGPETKIWHFAYDGDSFGPLSREQLARQVRGVGDAYEVLIWTKGMSSWAPIFEFHDLMDELGLNRRKFPRAKIDGNIVYESKGMTQFAQLKTISVGGCGVMGLTNAQSGSEIAMDIKSNAFRENIRAHAEIRYISESGFVGLKFKNISMEAQSAIIDYVRSSSSSSLKQSA